MDAKSVVAALKMVGKDFTFSGIITAVIDCGLLSEEAFCQRFNITLKGLAKWRSGEYVPFVSNQPRIYQLILQEIDKQAA